jgi:hypothetical protein
MTNHDETHLFDPDPYVDPRKAKPRRSSPKADPPPNLIESDGSWVAMARRGRAPHPYAHVLRPGGLYGLASTRCGIGGQALSIAAGSTVNACPVCAGSSATRSKTQPRKKGRR